MATRARKAAKRAKAPKRAKPTRKHQSTAVQSARPRSRKPKSGERKADKPKSETARLKNLLRDAEDRQAATAEILKVIASSPTEVGPALQAIVQGACKFCSAYDATVLLKIGDDLHYSAHYGPIPAPSEPHRITRRWVTGRSVVDKVPVQVSDFLAPEAAAEFPEGQRRALEQGHRCTLAVPLARQSEAIGAIVLRRLEPLAFTDKQIKLLQTFADQAVIAIENVRLFDEVQAKTRDLSEALQQQTATADVLKVISRSTFDLQTVLDTLVSSAARLCDADKGVIFQKDGDVYRLAANHGGFSEGFTEFARANPIVVDRTTTTGRVVLAGKFVQIHDVLDDPDYTSGYKQFGEFRTVLGVPLLREGAPIGSFSLTRSVVQPFSERQIELVQTFADQAVIAIENARLFNEVQARTADLQESLQQQIANADVLQVITSSPGELEPVFQAMLENAVRLCEEQFAMLVLYDQKENHNRCAVSWHG